MLNPTKLFQQYQDLKSDVPECILLMQVGVFMQLVDEDAKVVSELTGLKLKIGGTPEKSYISGGFPKSGLDTYVGKLVRAGHSVAVVFLLTFA